MARQDQTELLRELRNRKTREAIGSERVGISSAMRTRCQCRENLIRAILLGQSRRAILPFQSLGEEKNERSGAGRDAAVKRARRSFQPIFQHAHQLSRADSTPETESLSRAVAELLSLERYERRALSRRRRAIRRFDTLD